MTVITSLSLIMRVRTGPMVPIRRPKLMPSSNVSPNAVTIAPPTAGAANGMTPFVALVLMLSEQIDQIQRNEQKDSEYAVLFAQLNAVTAAEGAIGATSGYNPPYIMDALLFIVFVLVVRNCFTLAFVIVAAFLRVWRKPVVAETKLVVHFAIVVDPNRIGDFITSSKGPGFLVVTKQRRRRRRPHVAHAIRL